MSTPCPRTSPGKRLCPAQHLSLNHLPSLGQLLSTLVLCGGLFHGSLWPHRTARKCLCVHACAWGWGCQVRRSKRFGDQTDVSLPGDLGSAESLGLPPTPRGRGSPPGSSWMETAHGRATTSDFYFRRFSFRAFVLWLYCPCLEFPVRGGKPRLSSTCPGPVHPLVTVLLG